MHFAAARSRRIALSSDKRAISKTTCEAGARRGIRFALMCSPSRSKVMTLLTRWTANPAGARAPRAPPATRPRSPATTRTRRALESGLTCAPSASQTRPTRMTSCWGRQTTFPPSAPRLTTPRAAPGPACPPGSRPDRPLRPRRAPSGRTTSRASRRGAPPASGRRLTARRIARTGSGGHRRVQPQRPADRLPLQREAASSFAAVGETGRETVVRRRAAGAQRGDRGVGRLRRGGGRLIRRRTPRTATCSGDQGPRARTPGSAPSGTAGTAGEAAADRRGVARRSPEAADAPR